MGSSTAASNENRHEPSKGKTQKDGHKNTKLDIERKAFVDYINSTNGLYRKTLDTGYEEVQKHAKDRENMQTNRGDVIEKEDMSMELPIHMKEWSQIQESLQWFTRGKVKNGLKEGSSRWSKLSFQSLTELESIDGFVGPFSWRTRSLQDLSFPNSDGDDDDEWRQGTRHCRELSSEYVTIDGLKDKLKRDYKEAQEQREKYRHMLSSGGSKSIQRSEESIEFISRNLGPGRSLRIPRNRFPLMPLGNAIDDHPKFQLSPFKKKTFDDDANHSKYGQSINDILTDSIDIDEENQVPSPSEDDVPETRLTVKQISEDLDKILFRTKSPGVSPTAPTTDDVIDFLKNW